MRSLLKGYAQVTAVAPQHFSKTKRSFIKGSMPNESTSSLGNPDRRLPCGLKSGVISSYCDRPRASPCGWKNVEDVQNLSADWLRNISFPSDWLIWLKLGIDLDGITQKRWPQPSQALTWKQVTWRENGPADIILGTAVTALWTSHFASKAANSPFIGETLKRELGLNMHHQGQIVYQNWWGLLYKLKNRRLLMYQTYHLK